MDMKVIEREERLQKQVYVTEGHIVINVEYEYNIPISRCDTSEKLLHWICHLTEKTWMTNEVLRRFIETACNESSIEMVNA